MRRLVLAVVGVLAACDEGPGDTASEAELEGLVELDTREVGRSVGGVAEDGSGIVFPHAAGTAFDAASPTRFRGPLPISQSDFESASTAFPTWSFIEARLCHGDPDVAARYLTALQRAFETSGLVDPISGYFENLLPYCQTPEYCAWLGRTVTSELPEGLRTFVAPRLLSCLDAQTQPVIERGMLSDELVVRWYAASGDREGAIPHRLHRAILGLVDRGDTTWRFAAAEAIAQRDDDRLRGLYEELERGLGAYDRDALALHLRGRSEPWARSRLRAACRNEDFAGDPACLGDKVISAYDPIFTAPQSTFELEVRRRGLDDAKARLAACVGQDAAFPIETRSSCLQRLARLDWAQASALAGKLGFRSDPMVVETLLRFSSMAEVEQALRAWDLLPEDPDPNRGTSVEVTAASLLVRHGRLHWHPTGLAQDPGAIEWALYDLAARDPKLSDAVFESAWKSGLELDQAVLRIAAHAGQRRYLFELSLYDDWQAAEGITGILNTIAADQDDPMRFVPHEVSERGVAILMGPKAGLIGAHQAGLFGALVRE